MQDCTKNKSEEAAEAVPEAIKNMLLVLAAQGVLTPDWKVSSLLPRSPGDHWLPQGPPRP